MANDKVAFRLGTRQKLMQSIHKDQILAIGTREPYRSKILANEYLVKSDCYNILITFGYSHKTLDKRPQLVTHVTMYFRNHFLRIKEAIINNDNENKIRKVKTTSKPYISSPKTHGIVQIIKPFKIKSEPEVVEKDFAELPNPMASPENSILKRRAPESREEGLSPPRKKPVNFSDSPTTCEKVFFKDKNEHAHSRKDEHKETISDENGTNIQAVESITTSSTNTAPHLVEPMNIIEVPIVETLVHKQRLIDNDSEKEQLEEAASNIETESLVIETQGSVEVTDPYILEPILPEFINDRITCVLGKLANPLLVVRTGLRKFMSQKSPGTKPPTTDLQDNIKIEQNHVNNDQEQEITNETQQQIDHSSSLTPDHPKVTPVSSITLQPARSVSQNSPKTRRSPRRVPLINVTSLNTLSCSTIKQAVSIVEIEPSSSQESDSSKTGLFGNVEEREKLRIRIPELIADFQEMREKVKRQGLSATSLYELIIEIVGTEEFVSILLGNKASSIQNDAVNSLDYKISTTLDPEELALYNLHDKMSPGKRKDVIFKLFDTLSKAEAYEYWTKFFGKHDWKT